MRDKFSLAVVLAAALIIAGCKSEDVSALVTKVQAMTSSTCKFVPAASAVASILTSGNPAVATAAGAATAICNAIAAKGSAPLTIIGRNAEDAASDCVVVVEGVCVPGEPVGE